MIATINDLKTKKGIIYIIRNKVNWKRYIGQTIRTFRKRYSSKNWWKHPTLNKHIRYAIKKYGHRNFEIEILTENQSQVALQYWETFYIEYFQSNNSKYGYNLTNGGETRFWTKRVKIRQGKSKLMKVDDFIQRAIKKHGNKYDYSKVKIRVYQPKVKIFCKKHKKFFMQNRHGHLIGYGCKKCGIETQINSMRTKPEEFLNMAKEKFGDQFIYDMSNYISLHHKIKMIHKECGNEFSQIPHIHLDPTVKRGCPRCGMSKRNLRRVSVVQIEPDTNIIINIFDSISDATKFMQLGKSQISRACESHKKVCGFYWEFLKNVESFISDNKILPH